MVTLHSHATRLGVLDIGSNTVHMLIVDAAPGARPEPEASTKSHHSPDCSISKMTAASKKRAPKPCLARLKRR